ncbi:hypothetical protein [Chitinophaga arvensicola]|uniref:Uncharacterized protein n=1 Tax=Chitinophaga arvensicola TaxID=29529 RepID=A0A1I0QJG5_9BACT|nr:hypothetical protein [Chitinophaga arvensicola]SEW27073.1 hypothetical protein SAMN04488122_1506 [Chitinophaga arvensicola]
MEQILVDKFLKEGLIITSEQFGSNPYHCFSNEFGEYFIIHCNDNCFYISETYNNEICKVLEFYIKSRVGFSVYSYEIELNNKLSLEPTLTDDRLSLLYGELQYLKENILIEENLKYYYDLTELAKIHIHGFVAKYIEDWLIHWEEKKHIEFENITSIDTQRFHKEVDTLCFIERSKIVSYRIDSIISKKPTQPVKQEDNSQIAKLTWKGTPAHLALIIDLLIEKGYLHKPTPFAERTAEILLNIFDFSEHRPTKESLGKLLHKDRFPINDKTVIDRFERIPHRSELKR